MTAFLSHLPDDVSLNHRLIYHKFFCKLPVRIQENNAWLIFNDKENIHGIVTAYDNAWKSCRPPPTSWSELPSITRWKRRSLYDAVNLVDSGPSQQCEPKWAKVDQGSP